MVIVKLQGGLGNQMFQYAFARGISEKTGQDVMFDFSGFDAIAGVTPRSFSLDAFNITVQKSSVDDVRSFTQEKRAPRFTAIKRMLGFKIPFYAREKERSFYPKVWKIKGNAYFDGYWQSEKYFLRIEKEIREAFIPLQPISPNGEIIAKKINDSSISLHIRRGDYVTNKKVANVLGACELDYYKKAMSKAIQDINNPQIFIFSDDIAWVKKNLTIPYTTTYVSEHNLQNWEELVLMSRCRRHIISNSSFSWWGAWLDARSDKIVIAPKPWFKDPRLENKDITPPSWIRI